MWPFNILKKRFSRVEPAKKEIVRRSALIKLGILSRNVNKKTEQKFAQVFRTFFSEFFEVKYEFTYNELVNELKKKKMKQELREKISLIIEGINTVLYSSEKKLDEKKLKELIKETKSVITEL